MNIQDLFRRLSYGELSNLTIGSDGAGEIPEDKHERVIEYVNDGLLQLHSKFVLRENDLVLQQQEFITEYFLIEARSLQSPSTGPGDIKYILDYPDSPFDDDVIKILRVTNAEGRLIPLNDIEDTRSFFTPQPHVLQIPYPIQGTINGVVYQARHTILTADDLTASINLPVVLESALQSYVAYKVFLHMGGVDNANFAAAHLANYDRICNQVIDRDLVNSSSSNTSAKFNARGFV